MPRTDGIELRDKICETPKLQEKSIPFIFLTGHAEQDVIQKAYKLSVQGFFEKPTDVVVLQNYLKLLVEYWSTCKHPNTNKI